MIIAKLFLPIFLILMSTPIHRQERGVTALPMKADRFQGKPCQRFLSMFRGAQLAHTAILWDTFGDNRTCLRKYLALSSKMPVVLEIHPTCGACRRNPNYPLQPVPANSDVLERIRNFATRHTTPNVTIRTTLELEDEFSEPEAQDVTERFKRNWPYEIIRNSIHRFQHILTDFIELHGETARCPSSRYGADLDGSELSWPDIREWARRNSACRYLRVWKPEWQGIPGGIFRALVKRVFSISKLDVLEVRRFLKGE